MSRPAYVAMPGLSTVSVLLNLPCIAGFSGGNSPIVIMDTHDYERLRGPTLLGAAQSSQKDQYLTMAYDDLRRRGIVRLIDYSALYSSAVQDQRLEQNHELIEDIPNRITRQAARRGIERWAGYGRGTYQRSFRGTLGEDVSVFADLRKSENRLKEKMKRGTGDPDGWVRKMLDKNVAALEVYNELQTEANLNLQGVIGSEEHRLASDFLKLAHSQFDDSTTDILEEDHDLELDTPYLENLKDLKPHRRIVGLNSTVGTETRELLETVNTAATRISQVQHTDWTLFGLSFALPQYTDLFNFDIIQWKLRQEMDVSTLAAETQYILDELESEMKETVTPTKIRYESERIGEQVDLGGQQTQNRGLTDMITHAVEIDTYARKIRVLLEQFEVSQPAAFLATSIMNNPFRRYDEDAVYRRSMDLMRRFDPPTDETDKRFGWERTGETWTQNKDWYEIFDRER